MDGQWWAIFALGTAFGVIWSVSAAVIYVFVVEYRRMGEISPARNAREMPTTQNTGKAKTRAIQTGQLKIVQTRNRAN